MRSWRLRASRGSCNICGSNSDTLTRANGWWMPRCGQGSLRGQFWWRWWTSWTPQLGKWMAFPLGVLVWKLRACCNSSWGCALADVWSSPLAQTADHETPPHRTWYREKNKLNVSEQHCRTTIIGDITIIIIIIIYLWKVPSWTWTKF